MKGFGLYLIIILLLLSAVSYMLSVGNKSQEVPYSTVVTLFEEQKVEKFTYNDTTLTLELNDESKTHVTAKVPIGTSSMPTSASSSVSRRMPASSRSLPTKRSRCPGGQALCPI